MLRSRPNFGSVEQGVLFGLGTTPLSVPALVDDDLFTRRLTVRESDVVFVKGIFEASEGLCAMFAERGGDLVVAAPHARRLELDELLGDLVRELGCVLEDHRVCTGP